MASVDCSTNQQTWLKKFNRGGCKKYLLSIIAIPGYNQANMAEGFLQAWDHQVYV